MLRRLPCTLLLPFVCWACRTAPASPVAPAVSAVPVEPATVSSGAVPSAPVTSVAAEPAPPAAPAETHADEGPRDAPTAPDIAKAVAAAQASNAFTLRLYGRLRPSAGNFMFSGASVAIALAMVEAGARGETRAEMDRTLHVEAIADPGAAYGHLLRHLNALDGSDGVELHVADALWSQTGAPLVPAYVSRSRRDYGASVSEVDFAGNPGDAAAAINHWVSAATRDRIPAIVDELSNQTRLVVTNAVYFKGQWTMPFGRGTRDEDFHTPLETFKTATMKRTLHARHALVGDVHVLELPYRGGLSMLVALPGKNDGLAQLEASLPSSHPRWRAALAGSGAEDVDVSLPKWHSTWGAELTRALASMGMRRVFGGGADLGGIARGGSLRVSEVLHRSFIDVNEEGTEAAAATAITMLACALPVRKPPPVFRADHPFVYAIQDSATGAILFMGHVTDPRP